MHRRRPRWTFVPIVGAALFAAVPLSARQATPLTRAAAESILELDGPARHEAACAVLGVDLLQEVFGVGASPVQYSPMSMIRIPHGVCSAHWELPEREAREAECRERILAHARRRTEAMMRREAFDEPLPACPPTSVRVSLTVVDPVFPTPEEAVASLESVVGMLTDGVEVEVAGETHTARVEFERWVEGVGDRAAWAPGVPELHVAANGVRFAVSVTGVEGETEAFDLAVALATRLAG